MTVYSHSSQKPIAVWPFVVQGRLKTVPNIENHISDDLGFVAYII